MKLATLVLLAALVASLVTSRDHHVDVLAFLLMVVLIVMILT